MPALKNPRHEAFAQALARGTSAAAAYGQVGFRPHRANAATLARKEHISVRVAELQEEQLAIHKQARLRQEPFLRRADGREVLGQSGHTRGLHS